MFEIIMDGLKVVQTDKTVKDVLNTLCATTSALAGRIFTPVEYYALSLVITEAEEKIREIIKQGDSDNE